MKKVLNKKYGGGRRRGLRSFFLKVAQARIGGALSKKNYFNKKNYFY